MSVTFFPARRGSEGLGLELRDGGVAKNGFDRGGGGVEAAVQRAEVQNVIGILQRAFRDAAGALDGADDVEQGEALRRNREAEAAVHSALGGNDARADEVLHDFREVAGGNVSAFGDLLGGERGSGGLGGEAQDGSKRVFRGLGDHEWFPSISEER